MSSTVTPVSTALWMGSVASTNQRNIAGEQNRPRSMSAPFQGKTDGAVAHKECQYQSRAHTHFVDNATAVGGW